MEYKIRKNSVFLSNLIDSFSLKAENEKNSALQIAFLNSISLVITLACIAILCSVYFVLLPFIKPLLWAVLCGSVLHPIKQVLAEKLKKLLNAVEDFSFDSINWTIFYMPLNFLIHLSDSSFNFLKLYKSLFLKLILSISSGIIINFFMFDFLLKSMPFFVKLLRPVLNITLDLFSNTSIVFIIYVLVGIVSTLIDKPDVSNHFFRLSPFLLYVVTTSYISNFFYYIRIPLFVFFQIILICSYFVPKSTDNDQSKPDENAELTNEGDYNDAITQETTSLKYVQYLALICFVVLLYNTYIYYFFILLLILLTVIRLCNYFGVINLLQNYCQHLSMLFKSWFSVRKHVLIHPSLRQSLNIFKKIWKNFIIKIKRSCDSTAATIVILGLLLLVILGSLFLAIQVYREGVYLIHTGSSIVNSTVVHNPELHHFLPDGWEMTLDSALNNGYIYARETIANLIRRILKDKNISESRISSLENNALELWDRVYQAWIMPTLQPVNEENETINGPSVTAEAVMHSYLSLIEGLRMTPEVSSFSFLGAFLSNNMSTLTSSLESVWSILIGNMTLLLSVVSTLFTFLFDSGLSVINFALNLAIFLTALFYLLSSSSDRMYKPVEFLTQINPDYGNRLAIAVQQSCQEVLTASAKLSLFYGMWTWLIHTLLHRSFIYMPSVLASILGVVPVLSSYWVCLPAVLDLWLVQDSPILALVLLVAQILPSFFVDSTIYNEIQGGHPYLTGLSVAGGIFWLGLEGAIIGPLILCLLFVILNMGSSFTSKEMPNVSTSLPT